jgi:hypothetical protein
MRAQETWLPAQPRAVRSARAAVRGYLGEVDAATRADAELLTAEVIGNTLSHASGRGSVRLRLTRSGVGLRVEVLDPAPRRFSVLSGQDSEETAIVVRLLDAFSTTWGQERDSRGGRVLWFDLVTPRARRSHGTTRGALAG